MDLPSNQDFRYEDIEEIKKKLRVYSRKDILFNEPHFTQQMILREGNKKNVISNILSPDNLVYAYSEAGRYGDRKYSLYFKISNNRTLKIPIIFDRKNKKSLYIITYIMRYRKWQNMTKS